MQLQFKIILFLSLCFMIGSLNAQTLNGPTSVAVGDEEEYTFTDDKGYSTYSWEITGGHVVSQSHTSINFYATVRWNTEGAGSVKFKEGDRTVLTLDVTVSPDPNAPPPVDAGPDRTYCRAAGSINLADWGLSLRAGSWSGSGVVGNQVDLSLLSAGSYTLTYTRNSDGSSDTMVLTVAELKVGNIKISDLTYTCDFAEGNLSLENSNGTVGSPSSWEFSINNGVNWSQGLIMPIHFQQETLIRVKVDHPYCPSAFTQPATVRPLKPVAGFLNKIDAHVTCERSWGTLTLQNYYGDKITWQSSSDITDETKWLPLQGASGDQFSFDVTEHTYYRVKVENSTSSCSAVYSEVFWAKVGSVGGIATPTGSQYCETGTGFVNLTGKVGSIKHWEYSSNGVDWNEVTGSADLTSLPFNTTEPINYYKALIQLDACPAVYSTIATVQVALATNPGSVRFAGERQPAATIEGKLTFYPDFQLTGTIVGQIQHWRSEALSGENQFPVTTPDFSATINSTTAFSALVSSNGCGSLYSGKATFVINKLFEGIIKVLDKTILTEYDGHSYTVANAEGISIQDGFSFHANSEQEFFVLLDENYSLPQSNQNYVMKEVVLKEGVTDENNAYFLNAYESASTYTYLDDLGRVKQQVMRRASPDEKDFVKIFSYDQFGRQFKDFLPYEDNKNDGHYTGVVSNQAIFYANSNEKYVARTNDPYASFIYEASPNNRILESGSPGTEWQPGTGHTVKRAYLINQANTVLRWELDDEGKPFYRNLSSGEINYFDAGELYINEITDENGSKFREFIDKHGLRILKQVQNGNSWLETYFIYDDFNFLRYTIQPEGISRLSSNPDDSFLEKWSFQYRYDERGRVVQAKEPGTHVKYVIYDSRHRPVLIQDGNMRAKNQWNFIKYDQDNRPIIAGIYTYTDPNDPQKIISREDLIKLIPKDVIHEEYSGQAPFGYTSNVNFPSGNLEILFVKYYDNYDFKTLFSSNEYEYNNQLLNGIPIKNSSEIRGLVTGAQIRILDTEQWLINVNYYDDRYRLIQSVADNHLNGKDYISAKYDFANKIEAQSIVHKKGNDQIKIIEQFDYDHAGRVLRRYHQINNGPKVQLAGNEYNRLGQVIGKNLHQSADGFLQSIDYRYNIRGWLTHINNGALVNDGFTNDEANDFFGMELKHTDPTINGAIAQHNGNISQITWKSAGTNQQAYVYEYDKVNRLKKADFFDLADVTRAHRFSEKITGYDGNGNILGIERNGIKDRPLATEVIFGAMDQLIYSYNGNQLLGVEDLINNTTDHEGGFRDRNKTGNDYSYDNNGNALEDKNKNIVSISYNHLNLPKEIIKKDGSVITYSYNAAGQKLSQTISSSNLKTDYAGIFLYQNDKLEFIHHEEGRIIFKGSPEYQYHIRDHLGNIRLTFTTKNETESAKATLETSNAASEQGKFLYYDEAVIVNQELFDHTHHVSSVDPDKPTYYSTRLSGNAGERTGLAKSISVMPGDTIRMEVFAKYLDTNKDNWSTALKDFIALIASGSAPPGTIIDGGSAGSTGGFNFPAGGLLDKSGTTNPAPKAYMNYLIYDRNYKFLDGGYVRISEAAKEKGDTVSHEHLSKEIIAKQAGYVYIYLSNDNIALGGQQVEVYFDDFNVEHIKSLIVQTDDFYPFGLQASSFSRENSVTNNFLFNVGAELNTSTGLYETFFRQYDPALGRFNSIDPMASVYASWSPYNFGFNDPVYFNDPLGANPEIGPNPGFSPAFWEIIQKAWDQTPEGENWSWSNPKSDGGTNWWGSGDYYSTATGYSYSGDEWIGKPLTESEVSALYNSYVNNYLAKQEKPKTWYTEKHLDNDMDLFIQHTQTPTQYGYTYTRQSLILVYGEGGKVSQRITGKKVIEYIERGTVEQWENPKVTYSDDFGEYYPEMLFRIISAMNAHCDGCLPPMLVPNNRLNATSSGSSSYHRKKSTKWPKGSGTSPTPVRISPRD